MEKVLDKFEVLHVNPIILLNTAKINFLPSLRTKIHIKHTFQFSF